jgi:hypothetical protein
MVYIKWRVPKAKLFALRMDFEPSVHDRERTPRNRIHAREHAGRAPACKSKASTEPRYMQEGGLQEAEYLQE